MGVCVSKTSVNVSDGDIKKLPLQQDDYPAPDIEDSDSDSCYNTINGPEDLIKKKSGRDTFRMIGSFSAGSDIDVDQMFSGRSVVFGYNKIKLLGKGSSSEVYEVEKDSKHYAAKFCYISPITVNFLNFQNHQPKEEAVILRNFNHPFIIKIYDIIDITDTVLLIMELLTGGKISTITSDEKKKIAFAQSVAALQYVHSQRIAHRDIKEDNVLLDANGNIRLTDFGISEHVPPGTEFNMHQMKGTPSYSAPEVFSDKPYDIFVADIWSLGVMLYSLMFKRLPYQGKTLYVLQKNIETKEIEFPDESDKALVDLIRRMMNKNPKQRISLNDIWKHPWMNGMKTIIDETVEKLIDKSPQKRYDRKNSITFPTHI